MTDQTSDLLRLAFNDFEAGNLDAEDIRDRSLTSDVVLIERQTMAHKLLDAVAGWGLNECRTTRPA